MLNALFGLERGIDPGSGSSYRDLLASGNIENVLVQTNLLQQRGQDHPY
jgi:hypothetical protein